MNCLPLVNPTVIRVRTTVTQASSKPAGDSCRRNKNAAAAQRPWASRPSREARRSQSHKQMIDGRCTGDAMVDDWPITRMARDGCVVSEARSFPCADDQQRLSERLSAMPVSKTPGCLVTPPHHPQHQAIATNDTKRYNCPSDSLLCRTCCCTRCCCCWLGCGRFLCLGGLHGTDRDGYTHRSGKETRR